MSRIIGIDLGTTNSAAAFLDGKELKIIPNDRGNRITPSIAAFPSDHDILVGEAAKNQAVINANETVISVKRHMGTGKQFSIRGKKFSPEYISSLILKKVKKDAETYLGEEISQAVITVPAYFTEKQRRATQEAGKLAGLRVKRIINEPTAAALAYAYEIDRNRNILVYDLGGGTFDVTYLVKEGEKFTVKATCGDNNLGGIDFDELLLSKVLKDFSAKADLDLTQDKIIMQQLREQVERAKIELSSRQSALVALPFITGNSGPVHLSCTIDRKEFETLIRGYIERTVELAKQVIKDAGATPVDVESLILSGGSSRIPLVRSMLSNIFRIQPEKKINPEEVVALGAAVQASILSGEVDDIALQDITPFPLGLEIEGGKFIKILEKNTPIPIAQSRVFTTVSDNQNSVEIHVLQGESRLVKNNTSLGRFLLSGIRTGSRGEPRIKVNFAVDIDGILHVRAKDVDTGAEQNISVTAGFGSGDRDSDTYSTLTEAKNRVRSMLARIEKLSLQAGNRIDKRFRREIDETAKRSRECMLKGDVQTLQELQIALEVIIGELHSIEQIEREMTV